MLRPQLSAARPRIIAKHLWIASRWLVIYVFVGIQMGWVLRPFIGDPSAPVQFLREGSWSNAYEVLFQMMWDVLSGRGRR